MCLAGDRAESEHSLVRSGLPRPGERSSGFPRGEGRGQEPLMDIPLSEKLDGGALSVSLSVRVKGMLVPCAKMTGTQAEGRVTAGKNGAGVRYVT